MGIGVSRFYVDKFCELLHCGLRDILSNYRVGANEPRSILHKFLEFRNLIIISQQSESWYVTYVFARFVRDA